jgi:hypothetical protein
MLTWPHKNTTSILRALAVLMPIAVLCYLSIGQAPPEKPNEDEVVKEFLFMMGIHEEKERETGRLSNEYPHLPMSVMSPVTENGFVVLVTASGNAFTIDASGEARLVHMKADDPSLIFAPNFRTGNIRRLPRATYKDDSAPTRTPSK